MYIYKLIPYNCFGMQLRRTVISILNCNLTLKVIELHLYDFISVILLHIVLDRKTLTLTAGNGHICAVKIEILKNLLVYTSTSYIDTNYENILFSFD